MEGVGGWLDTYVTKIGTGLLSTPLSWDLNINLGPKLLIEHIKGDRKNWAEAGAFLARLSSALVTVLILVVNAAI